LSMNTADPLENELPVYRTQGIRAMSGAILFLNP
jgi:hypothetical protein